MAKEERSATRTKRRPLTFFYLNHKLHRKININRGADEIAAWNFVDEKLTKYSYAAVRRNMEPAFFTKEAGLMLNRGRTSLQMAISNGHIEEPQFAYTIENGQNGKKTRHLWHEDDIIAAHEYFSTQHGFRPRKDGLITPKLLPSLRELRAMIRHEEDLYVKVGGDFLPTYRAPNI